MKERELEFVLGLIGGILGVIIGLGYIFLVIVMIGVGLTHNTNDITLLSFWPSLLLVSIPMIFSIIGIIGAFIVRKKVKLGAGLMITGAIGSIPCVISTILLLTSSIMSLKKKEETKKQVKIQRRELITFPLPLKMIYVFNYIVSFIILIYLLFELKNKFSEGFPDLGWIPMMLILTMVVVGFTLLNLFLGKRKNWARLTYIILSSVGCISFIIAYALPLFTNSDFRDIELTAMVIGIILLIIPIYLLFNKKVKEIFAS